MWNNDDKLSKQNKIVELDQKIKEKELENKEIKQRFLTYNREFNIVQNQIQLLSKLKNKLIRSMRSTAAYLLGRRNIKQLYSRSYKIKNASNRLKSYKSNLYDLGFVEKSLEDLETLFKNTDDRYLLRAIAWELALWHANKYSQDGARQALTYLQIASDGEKDKEQLRKLAILQAECYDILGEREAGQQIIHKLLITEKHPDLYLAAANLEETIEERVKWINQAMVHHQLHPITFLANEKGVAYDDLRTMPLDKTVTEGPKVSVILPAFNFEDGIHIAIESILSQTWQNIELLVVDDCSTDQTVKVVQSYIEKDARVKLFSTPQNSGPYIARNIALKEATGEYITVNDADDWSHAEKIEIQVNHLINNQTIIANTSEHARLTDDLKLYRRGTPGIYIFPNMSSLMFRREPVMDKLGFWDSVRFAADGEFKRRLIKAFGKQSIVDLKTGPLSLPRQSVSSLTGSSAFGYSGFFMGVRKEYVESLEYHHNRADSLYYPYPQGERPFPVPEPMWPSQEEKPNGSRHFDVVIVADFQEGQEKHLFPLEEVKIHKEMGLRTGIVQMSCYNMKRHRSLNKDIREVIDGNDVQMLVYGENITCDVLIVKDSLVLTEKQNFIANIKPTFVQVVIDQLPTLNNKVNIYDFRRSVRHLEEYFGKKGKWYPFDSQTRQKLLEEHHRELRFINLSAEQWVNDGTLLDHERYKQRLDEWLIDDQPYTIK